MSSLGFSKRSNYSRCMNSAVYSLAMREHSRQEIRTKLSRKDFVEDVDLGALLDELEQNNYLSDERFTESFIRSRAGRGQGAVKIINDLKMRGVDGSLINAEMLEANIDWFELATEQREKKFGENKPVDFREKARQMRFLSGRGFDSETVRGVVG